MAVYVDESLWPYGRMMMCHLFADRLIDLHEMADLIGVDRKWFQDHRKDFPHYDICKSKRKLAVQHGAIELTRREMANWVQERRKQGIFSQEDEDKREREREERKAELDAVLWDADPNCYHELDPSQFSGIKCLHCRGWNCI